METIENREQYHDVVAQSLTAINTAISNKQHEQAALMVKCNIVYAYSLAALDKDGTLELMGGKDKNDLLEKVKALKLDKENDILKLYTMMTYYQHKAGIKPVQRNIMKGEAFERLRARK